MSYQALFIIYSCQARFHLSEALYERLNHHLPQAKVLLLYGDPTMTEEYKIVADKYLVLRVGDYYEHLADKTIMLIKACSNLYPHIQGIIKCDDDIVPCIPSINQNIQKILETGMKYAGNFMSSLEGLEYPPLGKRYDTNYNRNTELVKKSCVYACGGMYWLSKEAMTILYDMFLSKNLEWLFWEDMMVGYNLSKKNIFHEKILAADFSQFV
jgi:hypothetical protein